MTKRIFCLVSFLALACATCFGQSSFQGLTPGQSTRADAERVLGKPVQSVSKTLIEYKPQQNSDKIFVQYRDASPAAVVERIELTCVSDFNDYVSQDSRCRVWHESLRRKYNNIDLSKPDAFKRTSLYPKGKTVSYFGPPRFIVITEKILETADDGSEYRYAFYSRKLFESAVPTRGCTGALYGDWDTNYGRMTIMRDGDPIRDDSGSLEQHVTGTYSKNNGTFTGIMHDYGTTGEWKDDTGTGTMILFRSSLGEDTLTGEWERDTGRGPAKAKLTGRCTETKVGGSN
jgi:hypothetical protein